MLFDNDAQPPRFQLDERADRVDPHTAHEVLHELHVEVRRAPLEHHAKRCIRTYARMIGSA